MSEVRCVGCGTMVPAGSFCVRCGTPLATEPESAVAADPARRSEFAAAPHERLAVPWLVSTLFPHLPRASLTGFRLVLALGGALVAALAVLGLFPLAVVAAALLMPVLTLLYMYDVNVYEDEPLYVAGATIAWGAVAGTATALVAGEVAPAGTDLLTEPSRSTALLRAVAMPLAGVALMLAGPLALLPYRKFNDVLDGTIFGVTSAVSFVSAQTIAGAAPFLAGGLRPSGLTLPWIVLLATIAIAWPALVTGAIGTVTAALWQRRLAPPDERDALGVPGRPLVALLIAAGLVVGASVARFYLPGGAALAIVALLAVVAITLLRRAMHRGLLHEAAEIEVGPPIRCANCGAMTPHHSFCVNCGIARRALPKPVPRESARRTATAPG